MEASTTLTPRRKRGLRRLMLHIVASASTTLAIYGLLAYLILPAVWKHYEHHTGLEDSPKTTETSEHIPGDPLNAALIGTDDEVAKALLTAGWIAADPVTIRSSIHIATSVVRDRQYENAPISSLFLFDRHQDLAFERPAADSPRQRHHVRWWKTDQTGTHGRPLWLGAATFDSSVGLSHRTGQITHHIAADVDAERDQLMNDLADAGQLTKVFQVTGVGATLNNHNGGGDRYFTDGEMKVGVISDDNVAQTDPPEQLANPPAVEAKNRAWSVLRPLLPP